MSIIPVLMDGKTGDFSGKNQFLQKVKHGAFLIKERITNEVGGKNLEKMLMPWKFPASFGA